jgi:hypothetical protein
MAFSNHVQIEIVCVKCYKTVSEVYGKVAYASRGKAESDESRSLIGKKSDARRPVSLPEVRQVIDVNLAHSGYSRAEYFISIARAKSHPETEEQSSCPCEASRTASHVADTLVLQVQQVQSGPFNRDRKVACLGRRLIDKVEPNRSS